MTPPNAVAGTMNLPAIDADTGQILVINGAKAIGQNLRMATIMTGTQLGDRTTCGRPCKRILCLIVCRAAIVPKKITYQLPAGTFAKERNVTLRGFGDVEGFLMGKRYLIHDHDPLYTTEFLGTLGTAGVKSVKLPPRSPNLNAHAERFVRTIKESCLERVILFGEGSLRKAIHEFIAHYHLERNHQGAW